MPTSKGIFGINIQWPITDLILSGRKTIETRKYPLPKKHFEKELAIIETPGPRGKKEAGILKARIIGTIIFGESFRYETKAEWLADRKRHCVSEDDPQFGYSSTQPKWGWTILKVTRLPSPKPAPASRGIVFATNCKL